MPKSNKMQPNPMGGVEGRLEALTALAAGILRTIADDPKSKIVTGAEDRAMAAIFSAGVTQSDIGKILGVDINRVSKICKASKRR